MNTRTTLRAAAAALLLTLRAMSAGAAPDYPTGIVYRTTVTVNTNGVVTSPTNFWLVAIGQNGFLTSGVLATTTVPRAVYASSAGFSTNAETAVHAQTATALSLPDGSWAWTEIDTNGVQQRYVVHDDTSRVYVASASVDFNGPAVGTKLYALWEAYPTWMTNGVATLSWAFGRWSFNVVTPDAAWQVDADLSLPQTFTSDENESFGSCVIDYVPVTNVYPAVSEATFVILAARVDTNVTDIAAIEEGLEQRPFFGQTTNIATAVATAAPVWQSITNYAASITITNQAERPVWLVSTGAVSLAFAGLRAPAPLYLVVQGPLSLAVPGAYYVGGGTWQTNRANHFLVWKQGANLLMNAITTTAIED